jgi:Holliday junction resolvase RusA-like endonuclease
MATTDPHTAEPIRHGDHPPAASFFVAGRAAPGGSKRGIIHRHTGKVVMIDMGKGNKTWRARVAAEARMAFPRPPLDGPLEVWFDFVIARPKRHFRTGRFSEVLRPEYHHVLPTGPADVLKLARAAEDALTGVVWADDALIVSEHLTKRYGDQPGVHIVVKRIEVLR